MTSTKIPKPLFQCVITCWENAHTCQCDEFISLAPNNMWCRWSMIILSGAFIYTSNQLQEALNLVVAVAWVEGRLIFSFSNFPDLSNHLPPPLPPKEKKTRNCIFSCEAKDSTVLPALYLAQRLLVLIYSAEQCRGRQRVEWKGCRGRQRVEHRKGEGHNGVDQTWEGDRIKWGAPHHILAPSHTWKHYIWHRSE